MTSLDEIRNTLLQLPLPERAQLAGDLLASLEADGAEADCETAWAREVLARSNAYRGGSAVARDWRESLARVRQIMEKSGPTP